jgi:hypothetical protein
MSPAFYLQEAKSRVAQENSAVRAAQQWLILGDGDFRN